MQLHEKEIHQLLFVGVEYKGFVKSDAVEQIERRFKVADCAGIVRIGIDDDGHAVLFAVFEHDSVVLVGVQTAVAGLERAVAEKPGGVQSMVSQSQTLLK